MNGNQLNFEVLDTYKEHEKKTKNFEAVDNEDVINIAYLDEKLKKKIGHVSSLEKEYDDFKSQYDRQSVEEFLIQRAVKTTKQILYAKGIYDN